MELLEFSGYCISRTYLLACSALLALFRDNAILDESLTDTGRTFFIFYMGFIFISEVADGAQYRIGGGAAESA